MAEGTKKGRLTGGILRLAGIAYRRRFWFIVPFVSGIVLSLGLLVILTQFYDSSFFPSRIKQWLESETRQTIETSLDSLQKQLDQEKANMGQFEKMNPHELASRMKANLRVLGQLHVDLYEIKAGLQADAHGEKSEETEQIIKTWLNKKSALDTLRKRYSGKHPQVIALEKEMQILVKKIAAGKNQPALSTLPLDTLKVKEAQLMAQIHLYESRIERTLDKEKTLAGLVAQYNHTKDAYHTLLQKKPSYTPDPVQIGINGIVIGFLVGSILIIFREKMDHSIHMASELEQFLSVPVLATIFDDNILPQEGKARPSATWSSGSGDSLYGQKTLSLARES